MEAHAESEKTFDALRKSLGALPALLKPDLDPDESADTPLVCIIDELDRCRPDFALGILETLKHFFRSDGVHFVLVTNGSHLELSVSARYGLAAASQEYLEKFFDFTVIFDHSYDRHTEGNINRFVSSSLNQLLPPDQEREDIRKYIQAISSAYRLSLREISAISTNIAIAYLAARKGEFRPTVLVTFLAAIKTLRPSIYRLARSSELTGSALFKFLDEGSWNNEVNIDRIKEIFEYYLLDELPENSQKFSGYGRELWNFNITRERVIPFLATSIIDRFGGPAVNS